MYTKPLTEKNLTESLISRAWISMSEETLVQEVTKALLYNEVYQDAFLIKTFLPVHPQMRKRLLSDRAYEGVVWDEKLNEKNDKA